MAGVLASVLIAAAATSSSQEDRQRDAACCAALLELIISGYDDAVSSDGKVLSRNELADQSATAAAALAELRGLGPADVVPLAQDLERSVLTIGCGHQQRSLLVTRESIRRSGLRSYYGAPMMLGDELVGVATIGSRSAAEFSEEDCLLFRTMSGRAAALIAQARAEAELARRNDELAGALEYRNLMLGVLSHDLHNPLAVILMSADALGRGEPLSEMHQRAVRRVAANARRVENLVRDLLDYTRAGKGQTLPISPREADLLALCHQVVDGLQALHPDVELRCTAEGRTDGWFDSDRVTQVISNLVTNGITHGAAGAPVTVALRGSDQGIWMEVHNEGPPIPEALLPHIFEAFRHGSGAPKATPGLGLGLFIAQQIVAAHGGSIEVQSKDEEGTTVRVRWPRRDSQPSARP